jgi:hypothetical protein
VNDCHSQPAAKLIPLCKELALIPLWEEHGTYPSSGRAWLSFSLSLCKKELGSYDAIQDCNFFGYSKTLCKTDTSCMDEQENASQTNAIDPCKEGTSHPLTPALSL